MVPMLAVTLPTAVITLAMIATFQIGWTKTESIGHGHPHPRDGGGEGVLEDIGGDGGGGGIDIHI